MILKSEWKWRWDFFDVTIIVSDLVADTFKRHVQFSNDFERGGQLFVDLTMADGLWLSEASLPHPDDAAGVDWLHLNQERCTAEIINANQRGLRLVGYWHTHPENIPTISPQDVMSFRKFSALNSTLLQNPLVVVVGRHAVDAWIVTKAHIEKAKLSSEARKEN